MEFEHNHDAWAVGQHFFLTFPALTIWQSHPFTVASVPSSHPQLPRHVYIVRCRKGETGRLKSLVSQDEKDATTPVVLCGPYGTALLPVISPETTNILAIAGGTGISLTLPLVLAATALPVFVGAAIDFVWIIRRASNTQWISQELAELKRRAARLNVDLRIHVFVTQEDPKATDAEVPIVDVDIDEKDPAVSAMKGPSPGSDASICSVEEGQRNFKITYLRAQRPSLHELVTEFVESRASSKLRTRVIASGPASMGSDLRAAVAALNNGGKVWRDDRRFDISLDWDDRMG